MIEWHARELPVMIVDPETALGLGSVTVIGGLIWWLIRRETRQNRCFEQNLCIACGYNLTNATAICPECGLPTNFRDSACTEELSADLLASDWPDAVLLPPPPVIGANLFVIFIGENGFIANRLSEQLNVRGIWAKVSRMKRPGTESEKESPLEFAVVVSVEDASPAREIVRRFRKPKLEELETRAGT